MYLLKNRFLNTTAVLLAPPDADDRSDAQKQRDSIEINESVSNAGDNKEDENENKDNNADSNSDDDIDTDDDNEDDDNENVDDEENKDEDKDEKKEEAKQETEEEKTARLAAEKEERREARVQKRINKAVAAMKAAEARAEAAEAKLKETPVEGLSEEEVQRRADAIAADKLKVKQIEDTQKQFEKNCDKLADQAKKIDAKFDDTVQKMADELGPIPTSIIETLVELDNENGGEVLSYLTRNIDEAEDIYALAMDDRKLTIKLTRISDKLAEAKKKPKKDHSRLPPPITPVSEGNRKDTTGPLTGKESMEDYVAKRNKMEADRRAQRGY